MIYEQSNTPVDPGVLERVMDRLSHRGPDGRDVKVDGHVAMGHWHFWTTPEEVGETQPLELPGLPFTIVLDGRLDNRSGLLDELSVRTQESEQLSDAALILQAYERWGEHCFEHFIGEFAVVIFNKQSSELICARDALGDRTLFYSIKGTRLVIASEPWAVAGADNSPVELDERAAAHYFALKATEDGQTLFKNIFELLPAHVMVHSRSGSRTWRYWQPDPSTRLRGRSDIEYAEEFRSLLEESVRCRMRSTTPVGVLMSGGLDSTSVACLAARMIEPERLTTISYVFDELPDCDERKYIQMVKDRWQINSIQIPCDDAWPWKDWEHWPQNPNRPEGNPYRLIKERAYDRAKQEGLRVLLTGGFGDHLYSAGKDWLADMVYEGRLLEAYRELNLYLRYNGFRWTLQSGFLQGVVRRLINPRSNARVLHRRSTPPKWLTPFSAGMVNVGGATQDPTSMRHVTLLGKSASASSSAEIYNASCHSLELRHPYRDLRLIEFILKLPAYQLYNRGLYKHILRTAMQNILPDAIRTRTQQTSLVSLYSRGIDKEKNSIQFDFQDITARWRKYVRSEWIVNRWCMPVTVDTDGPEALVGWLCTSFSKWYNYAEFPN